MPIVIMLPAFNYIDTPWDGWWVPPYSDVTGQTWAIFTDKYIAKNYHSDAIASLGIYLELDIEDVLSKVRKITGKEHLIYVSGAKNTNVNTNCKPKHGLTFRF